MKVSTQSLKQEMATIFIYFFMQYIFLMLKKIVLSNPPALQAPRSDALR